MHPINLIEHAAITEVHVLHTVPTAERLIDRKQRERFERIARFRERCGIAGPEVMLRDQALTFRRIKKLEISLGDLPRAATIDNRVDDRDWRLS